ncbi:MAG: NAD(P)H-dependent glycerol-3-phosphate dehydrogenase [Candidatus Cloacimonetes bacterium]|nr:NAD(P)H-dependent glycerol-3-phosphate dehydrogenase [Candidatus Cloacimonadota bacterium]
MKVTIIGCGRWGTFLGWYSNKIGNEVLIWGRENSKNLNELKKNRKNEYLVINNDIILSNSMEEAISFSEAIIISVSSQYLRDVCKQMNNFDLNGKTIILAMKGIENNTGLRLTQVVAEVIKQNIKIAVWVGPGHVQSFVDDIPNCMLISSEDIDTIHRIIKIFNSNLIRLYIGQDLIGIEIGAAAKNVIGIAAGMLDGFNYGSLKGALMARGSREISRLVTAIGGNELTIYGLSHIGDYEATLFSKFSNNRKFGEDFIKGKEFSKLAEGASTVKSLILLSKKYNVDMPICEAIYSIIYDKKEPKTVLKNLFLRPTKFEF